MRALLDHMHPRDMPRHQAIDSTVAEPLPSSLVVSDLRVPRVHAASTAQGLHVAIGLDTLRIRSYISASAAFS